MAINKVEFGNQTLIDLTSDTVDSNNLLEGETAHTRSGESVVGQAHIPTGEIRKATNKFKCFNGGLLEKCVVKLDPVQDLHGQSYPWVGGVGKNVLPLTVNNIMALNGGASSWANNKKTINGVEFEILVDNDNNVIGIKVNRTSASSNHSFLELAYNDFSWMTASTQYKLNGCPSEGSQNTYAIAFQAQTGTVYWDEGSGKTFTFSGTVTENTIVRIVIRSSYSPSNMVFKPMIRLASESDATFAPYTNVASIIPHTQSQVLREGKNLFDASLFDTDVSNRVTYVHYAVENGTYIMSTPDFPMVNGITNVFFIAGNANTGASSSNNGVHSSQAIRITVTDGYFTVAYRSIEDTNGNNPKNFKWQIEKGSTSTSYEPYKGQLCTLQLGQNVYSAYIDFISGEMTIVGVYIAPTSVYQVNLDSGSGKYYWIIKGNCGSVNGPNVVSSHFRSQNGIVAGNCYIANQGQHMIAIPPDQSYNTKALADAWCVANNPQFVYKLATPITVQLTPTQIEALVMENNVSCPLDFQNIDEDGIEYRDLFVWENVTDEVKDSENGIYKVIGVKNRLPFPYTDSGNKSTNGIDFVDNGDGTITIKSGTASANATYWLRGNGTTLYESLNDLKEENYVISCGFESIPNVVAMNVNFYDSSRNYLSGFTVTNSGVAFDIPDNAVYYVAFLRVYSGKTISSDIVTYPMLRLASIADPTYQPYAMTNKELTESVFNACGIFAPTKNYGLYTGDINDLKSGIRYVASTATNLPTAKYGVLILFDTADNSQNYGFAIEIFIPNTINEWYIRRKDSGTWSSWYKYSGTVVS